jgi:hypothetical protein
MVRVRYGGLNDPKGACLALKPYRDRLIELGARFRPFGPEYRALDQAVSALDDAIGALCGDRELLHLKPNASEWKPPGDGGGAR